MSKCLYVRKVKEIVGHPLELGLSTQRYDTSNVFDTSDTSSKVLTTTSDKLRRTSAERSSVRHIFQVGVQRLFSEEVHECFNKAITLGFTEVDNLVVVSTPGLI